MRKRVIGGVILCLGFGCLVWAIEPEFQGRTERSIAQMYDEDDLSACSLFAGHFINFGFWEESIKNKIGVAERIESEKNLYRFVLRKLEVGGEDRILEVACGLGVGSALVLAEFHPKEIHGIDFSKAQILRAKKINEELLEKSNGKLFFLEGSAENIPYESDSFEKLFSVEAAQHFESLELFANEAYRVLKPGGKLAIASFFGTSDQSEEHLSKIIQTVRDGIDKATPIYKLENILRKSGFKNIKIESLGKNVWHGYDLWMSQTDLRNSWGRNWYKGYQKGFLDYYIITAEKTILLF